jgi:hypothetical protein
MNIIDEHFGNSTTYSSITDTIYFHSPTDNLLINHRHNDYSLTYRQLLNKIESTTDIFQQSRSLNTIQSDGHYHCNLILNF